MPERGKGRFRQVVAQELRQAWRQLLFATLCTMGLVAMQLSWPWPIKIVIDHLLLAKPLPSYLALLQGVFETGPVFAVGLISLSIVVIALLRGIFSYGHVYITSQIGYCLVYRLRQDLFAHLQRLSLSFHNRARTGELLNKITGDTALLKDVFAESVLTFSTHVLTLLGMFAIMFAMNWQLGLIALATLPILVSTLAYLYRKVRVSTRKQRRQEGRLSSRLSQVLAAMPMVQAFGRSDYEVVRFAAESAETMEESIRTARMEAAATRAVEIIGAFGTGTVVLFGALQVLKGALTPGDLLIFTGYLNGMYKPIRGMAKLSTRFSKAAVGAERIAEVLDIEPEIQDHPDALDAKGLKGEIVFERVSFGYEPGKKVLEEISFRIRPGQRVALVGGSGAGKSTLASLILRLYDPVQGTVLIDGIDIRRYRLESLRRAIGIVLQEALLFGATIRENVAYGKLDASDDEIVTAAKLANADEFIRGLEHGYDTVIGERGVTLSGGQRQRIAIARALIRDCPILVLDEPMAGLDAHSEAEAKQALDRLMAGKTCVTITHDLAAAADLILMLKDGQLVEQGSHAELMALRGDYRSLYERQAGNTLGPVRESA